MKPKEPRNDFILKAMELFQNKEFKEVIQSIINPITNALGKNKEKEVEIQKEKLEHDKVVWQIHKTLTARWQIYNFSLYFVAVVAIGVLGWLKIIPDTAIGTLLAAVIGYALGEKDRKKKEDK